jgi:hypothetical protein
MCDAGNLCARRKRARPGRAGGICGGQRIRGPAEGVRRRSKMLRRSEQWAHRDPHAGGSNSEGIMQQLVGYVRRPSRAKLLKNLEVIGFVFAIFLQARQSGRGFAGWPRCEVDADRERARLPVIIEVPSESVARGFAGRTSIESVRRRKRVRPQGARARSVGGSSRSWRRECCSDPRRDGRCTPCSC